MIVSVILARGGSKEIPRKNIVDVNGKPLLHYTVKASLKSNVQETWVSTDDEEISQIAVQLGAKVLKRPAELASDTSASESALIHFANSVDFEQVVFIQPTSPLLKAKYINAGLQMMSKHDSIFSAYVQHWLPSWTKELLPQPIGWDPNHRPRRQDIEEIYVENGAFYITTKKALIKSGLRFSGKIGVVEMPLNESYQIDTYDDLKFVKNLLRKG